MRSTTRLLSKITIIITRFIILLLLIIIIIIIIITIIIIIIIIITIMRYSTREHGSCTLCLSCVGPKKVPGKA